MTPELLDAAENSNWQAVHVLHDRYAAATGARAIPHDQAVPEGEHDAAIRWAKGMIGGDA